MNKRFSKKQNLPPHPSGTQIPLLCFFYVPHVLKMASQAALVVKNPPANAGDVGLICVSGRFSREGNGSPLSTPAWIIAWTEEHGRLQSMGSKRVGHNGARTRTHTHMCTHVHFF